MFNQKQRSNPNAINAGSMADIAFLLLIFFLVTTTIEADTGINRILPPNVTDITTEVPGRDVLQVLVNTNDQLLVEGQWIEVKELKAKAKEFIKGYQGDDAHLDFPNFKPTDSPNVAKYFGEGFLVSKQIVSLQNDRGTSYETYIAVQNELAAAYHELRNELSREKFGKSFDELVKDARNTDKADAIKAIYPMRISEASPVAH